MGKHRLQRSNPPANHREQQGCEDKWAAMSDVEHDQSRRRPHPSNNVVQMRPNQHHGRATPMSRDEERRHNDEIRPVGMRALLEFISQA